ncbi:MAG: SdpI family protein [Polyangiaceae bacterium]
MSRSNRVFDAGTLLLLGGAVALTAAVYPDLPARIPTHFGLSGYANDWTRREIGAWLVPGIAVATWALVRFAAAWCPGAWKERAARSPMAAGAFLTASLLASIQATILWASFHPGESVGRGLAVAMGVFLLALSFVMPRIRRNPVIGIRVAWTLASDENWARTHRFASYTFAAAGVVALAGALFGGTVAGPIAIAALLLGALAPTVYSYVVARDGV